MDILQCVFLSLFLKSDFFSRNPKWVPSFFQPPLKNRFKGISLQSIYAYYFAQSHHQKFKIDPDQTLQCSLEVEN